MLYIFGKNLSTHTKILYTLTKIFGINLNHSLNICKNLGINPTLTLKFLNKNSIKKLIKYIENNLLIEQDLRLYNTNINQNFVKTKNIRGLRKLKGLTVNGQRTKTNGKTQKKLKK